MQNWKYAPRPAANSSKLFLTKEWAQYKLRLYFDFAQHKLLSPTWRPNCWSLIRVDRFRLISDATPLQNSFELRWPDRFLPHDLSNQDAQIRKLRCGRPILPSIVGFSLLSFCLDAKRNKKSRLGIVQLSSFLNVKFGRRISSHPLRSYPVSLNIQFDLKFHSP